MGNDPVGNGIAIGAAALLFLMLGWVVLQGWIERKATEWRQWRAVMHSVGGHDPKKPWYVRWNERRVRR